MAEEEGEAAAEAEEDDEDEDEEEEARDGLVAEPGPGEAVAPAKGQDEAKGMPPPEQVHRG